MQTIDDRGRRADLARIPRSIILVPLVTDHRVSESQRERMNRVTRLGCLFYPALLVFVTPFVVNGVFNQGAIPFVVIMFIFTALIVVGVWFSRRVWRMDAVPRLSAHGYCGACLYRIEGLPAADDGCSVCPECGAAWRVQALVGQSSNESE